MAKTKRKWRVGVYIANAKANQWRSKTIGYYTSTEEQAMRLLAEDITTIALVMGGATNRRKAKDG